jgi:hypothetical protein
VSRPRVEGPGAPVSGEGAVGPPFLFLGRPPLRGLVDAHPVSRASGASLRSPRRSAPSALGGIDVRRRGGSLDPPSNRRVAPPTRERSGPAFWFPRPRFLGGRVRRAGQLRSLVVLRARRKAGLKTRLYNQSDSGRILTERRRRAAHRRSEAGSPSEASEASRARARLTAPGLTWLHSATRVCTAKSVSALWKCPAPTHDPAARW